MRPIPLSWSLFLSFSLLPSAFAQAPAESQKAPPPSLDLDIIGYVVRVDTASDSIYLDLGEKSGAEVGQNFIVYKEGDELTHPITGKGLGRMEMKLAEGSVREIHPGYSVGSVGKLFGKMTSGMRARLTRDPKIAASGSEPSRPVSGNTFPTGAGAAAAADDRLPRWKSGVFDFRINSMAIGNFKDAGQQELAVADDAKVYLYAYPPENLKPLAEYKLPGISPRVLSLEAADLNGNGRAEVFVTVFNASFNRVESSILELSPEGAWTKIADIPWIVRGRQDEAGRRVLEVQQLHEDGTFPFSGIYPLEYKDGKYSPGKTGFRHKRVDWIYGFATANFAPADLSVLTLTNTDRLRIDFKKGYWKTEEAYAQTPVRLTWSGRILQCHPRLEALYGEKGFEALFVIKNIAALGGFAQPFGIFSSAEIYRKDFNGLGLVTAWKAPLTGYATSLVLAGPKDLAVAVVGTSGKSAIWIYDP